VIPEHFISDPSLQIVVRPQFVPEIGALVRQAAVDGKAIYPIGGQTMWQLGRPLARDGIAIDLCSLNQVIDYPARDMTITVQAGITIAQLQAILATENQRLPIDVPLPDQATLGGALATNVSGPRRYGFGSLRDYVIGISVINDQGEEVKAGGRVVKNVAGYDLCKLYIGSLGTLGIITQVTLKLKPRPEQSMLVELLCPSERVGPALDHVHASRTRPASISLLNEDPLTRKPPATGWVIWIGYEDNRDAVAWQVQQLQRECSEIGISFGRKLTAGEEVPFWTALTDFPLWPETVLTFKANLLPSAVADFCAQATGLPEKPRLQAEAGNGIVTGHISGDLTLERARRILTTLQLAANERNNGQSNVIVLFCPPAWKTELPIWGDPRGDISLMRAIKGKLDPKRIFNPGRFVDGI